uniref:Uncharacterized protein n=1 Tax=Musa acuminata subsp. malaccensis TaxID=214687 RepID=A0A804IF92_MUSAM
MTLMLMVICSIAIGLSFGHTAKGVMATLRLFRFCLGFGIGGDYLLSATIMSEVRQQEDPRRLHRSRFHYAGLRHPHRRNRLHHHLRRLQGALRLSGL